MARKVIKNPSLILSIDDYGIVKAVCEKISETEPQLAEDAMSLWVSHNRENIPAWY